MTGAAYIHGRSVTLGADNGLGGNQLGVDHIARIVAASSASSAQYSESTNCRSNIPTSADCSQIA